MSEWQWYAVRCCCTPIKIFGFLRLPAQHQRHYRVREKAVMQPLKAGLGNGAETALASPVHEVRLEMLRSPGTEEFAIYSEDRPIEFWRNIDGFIEAQGSIE
jgi:hypothetical protein